MYIVLRTTLTHLSQSSRSNLESTPENLLIALYRTSVSLLLLFCFCDWYFPSFIHSLRTDTTILGQIQRTLNTELLVLNDMTTGVSPNVEPGQMIVYILAGLAGFLAILCVILLLTYYIKTRR